LTIVGLATADSKRQEAFIGAVQRALMRYPDLAAAQDEQPRSSFHRSALEPLRVHSRPLFDGLANLEEPTRQFLRRQHVDVDGLAESVLALDQAVDGILTELSQDESRGAPEASAREQVLAWLTEAFNEFYPDPPAWHRRKVLVQFLRRSCRVVSIDVPKMDHQLIALLPAGLRPPTK
jgi:hypothetical protein